MEQANGPIRVLIADDDEDTRAWLTLVLNDEASVEVVGFASDTQEAVELVEELKPDVAILDWAMPGGGGGKAAQAIKAGNPSTQIVAYTGMDAASASHDMLTAGAVGFVQKGGEPSELISAIHSAVRW